jgi:hypothetical protein
LMRVSCTWLARCCCTQLQPGRRCVPAATASALDCERVCFIPSCRHGSVLQAVSQRCLLLLLQVPVFILNCAVPPPLQCWLPAEGH